MKKLFLVGLALWCAANVWAQTEIKPYASEASVHGLVGKKVKVSGTYYREVFDSPVILIKGYVFHLLQNPPSKQTYNFPIRTREATVSGTLYFYDHAQLNNADYGAVGERYFFFNIDGSEIKFGEASVGEGLKNFIKTWKYNYELTKANFGSASGVMESEKLKGLTGEKREFADMFIGRIDKAMPELFKNSRLLVGEDAITLLLFDKDSKPTPYDLKSVEGNLLKVNLNHQGNMVPAELEIMDDGRLRYTTIIGGGSSKMNLYFDP